MRRNKSDALTALVGAWAETGQALKIAETMERRSTTGWGLGQRNTNWRTEPTQC